MQATYTIQADDKEVLEIHTRMLIASLYSVAALFEALSDEQHGQMLESSSPGYTNIIDAKFFRLLASKDTSIRRAAYAVVSASCQKLPSLIEGKLSTATPAIFGAIADQDAAAHSDMWQAVLLFIVKFPNVWAQSNAAKQVLPKLWALLRNGCRGSGKESYPTLLPMISVLPASVVDGVGREVLLEKLFSSTWAGMSSADLDGQEPALLKCYMECMAYLSCGSLERTDDADGTELGSILGKHLLVPVKHLLDDGAAYDSLGSVFVESMVLLINLNYNKHEKGHFKMLDAGFEHFWQSLVDVCKQEFSNCNESSGWAGRFGDFFCSLKRRLASDKMCNGPLPELELLARHAFSSCIGCVCSVLESDSAANSDKLSALLHLVFCLANEFGLECVLGDIFSSRSELLSKALVPWLAHFLETDDSVQVLDQIFNLLCYLLREEAAADEISAHTLWEHVSALVLSVPGGADTQMSDCAGIRFASQLFCFVDKTQARHLQNGTLDARAVDLALGKSNLADLSMSDEGQMFLKQCFSLRVLSDAAMTSILDKMITVLSFGLGQTVAADGFKFADFRYQISTLSAYLQSNAKEDTVSGPRVARLLELLFSCQAVGLLSSPALMESMRAACSNLWARHGCHQLKSLCAEDQKLFMASATGRLNSFIPKDQTGLSPVLADPLAAQSWSNLCSQLVVLACSEDLQDSASSVFVDVGLGAAIQWATTARSFGGSGQKNMLVCMQNLVDVKTNLWSDPAMCQHLFTPDDSGMLLIWGILMAAASDSYEACNLAQQLSNSQPAIAVHCMHMPAWVEKLLGVLEQGAYTSRQQLWFLQQATQMSIARTIDFCESKGDLDVEECGQLVVHLAATHWLITSVCSKQSGSKHSINPVPIGLDATYALELLQSTIIPIESGLEVKGNSLQLELLQMLVPAVVQALSTPLASGGVEKSRRLVECALRRQEVAVGQLVSPGKSTISLAATLAAFAMFIPDNAATTPVSQEEQVALVAVVRGLQQRKSATTYHRSQIDTVADTISTLAVMLLAVSHAPALLAPSEWQFICAQAVSADQGSDVETPERMVLDINRAKLQKQLQALGIWVTSPVSWVLEFDQEIKAAIKKSHASAWEDSLTKFLGMLSALDSDCIREKYDRQQMLHWHLAEELCSTVVSLSETVEKQFVEFCRTKEFQVLYDFCFCSHDVIRSACFKLLWSGLEYVGDESDVGPSRAGRAGVIIKDAEEEAEEQAEEAVALTKIPVGLRIQLEGSRWDDYFSACDLQDQESDSDSGTDEIVLPASKQRRDSLLCGLLLTWQLLIHRIELVSFLSPLHRPVFSTYISRRDLFRPALRVMLEVVVPSYSNSQMGSSSPRGKVQSKGNAAYLEDLKRKHAQGPDVNQLDASNAQGE
jgi:hypothetical protein